MATTKKNFETSDSEESKIRITLSSTKVQVLEKGQMMYFYSVDAIVFFALMINA